ncbi:MAG: glycosyltransferase family 87 protein [Caulobacteraceae bacterium]
MTLAPDRPAEPLAETGFLLRLDRLVTADRVRTYVLMLIAAYVLGAVGWALSMRHDVDPLGKPFGSDFIIFYAASSLALKGQAAAAYLPTAILAAERAAVTASRGLLLWCYPPTFQLLILPLALLPYKVALAAWVGTSLTLYLAIVRLISRAPQAWLLALAFPGVFLCVLQGQNGFLTTALLGGSLLLLDRRPWLAGLLLGLLLYKPQFGVLMPLLLVATRRWRTILAAAASGGFLIAASTALFGVEAWRSFFSVLPSVAHNLSAGLLPLFKVPSLFATLRLLGAPDSLALGANLIIGLAVAVAALAAWLRPGPLPLKAGLAVTATLLLTPYAFDYDLVLLAIPLGVLAEHSRTCLLPPGARALLALGFISPIAMLPLSTALHLQLMPLVLLALCAVFWRVLAEVQPAKSLAEALPAAAT